MSEKSKIAGTTCMALLTELSREVVPVLIEAAVQALQLPEQDGLDFAVEVLKDAQKYNNIYPHARIADELMVNTIRLLKSEDRGQS